MEYRRLFVWLYRHRLYRPTLVGGGKVDNSRAIQTMIDAGVETIHIPQGALVTALPVKVLPKKTG